MEYSFDTDVAIKYGVTAAILLKNIGFWVAKNINNKKHFYANRYWTYNSSKAFAQLYPFWTSKQIWLALDKLVDAEVLIKGNFNITSYDRTTWYTIIDEWVFEKYVSPICQKGKVLFPSVENGVSERENLYQI